MHGHNELRATLIRSEQLLCRFRLGRGSVLAAQTCQGGGVPTGALCDPQPRRCSFPVVQRGSAGGGGDKPLTEAGEGKDPPQSTLRRCYRRRLSSVAAAQGTAAPGAALRDAPRPEPRRLWP